MVSPFDEVRKWPLDIFNLSPKFLTMRISSVLIHSGTHYKLYGNLRIMFGEKLIQWLLLMFSYDTDPC